MKLNKDIIPPYAEEQTIDQKIAQIEEILSQFKQPIPTNFTELGQPKKYWGSTEGWKEPVCERYSFRHNDKLITLDIEQKLSDKLKPTPEDHFHLSPKILTPLQDDNKEEIIITIKNEKEIFIDRPLTINDLPIALQRWKTKIKTLKEQVQTLEREKTTNQRAIASLTTERDDYQTKWDISLEELEQKEEIVRGYLRKIEELERDLQTTRDQLTIINNLIANFQTLLRTNDLDNLPQIPEGETLNSLLARPTPNELQAEKDRVTDLERKTNDLKRERDACPNITLTEWNTDYSRRPTQQQLTNLQNELNNVRTELNNTKRERDDYRNRYNNHTCSSTSYSSFQPRSTSSRSGYREGGTGKTTF